MKKLILLLLISGGLSAQVVVPKSTTTFSNVNAVGSMTVGGNLRVTGSETITGSTTLTGAVTTATNVTVGGKLSAASLSVTAQTFSVGTTNYTAGNTGTVAVLSDAVFPMFYQTTALNPADGSNYYFSNMALNTTSSTLYKMFVPFNCILVGYSGNVTIAGTLGTTESATLNIVVGGVTSSTINITNTFNMSTAVTSFTASGLSSNVDAGSYVTIELKSPTWATNPTSVYEGFTLWFVRRQ